MASYDTNAFSCFNLFRLDFSQIEFIFRRLFCHFHSAYFMFFIIRHLCCMRNFIFLYGVLSYALYFFFQYLRCLCSDLRLKSILKFNFPIDLLGFRSVSVSDMVNTLCEILYFEIPIYLSYHSHRIDFKVLTPLLDFGYERLNCLR